MPDVSRARLGHRSLLELEVLTRRDLAGVRRDRLHRQVRVDSIKPATLRSNAWLLDQRRGTLVRKKSCAPARYGPSFAVLGRELSRSDLSWTVDNGAARYRDMPASWPRTFFFRNAEAARTSSASAMPVRAALPAVYAARSKYRMSRSGIQSNEYAAPSSGITSACSMISVNEPSIRCSGSHTSALRSCGSGSIAPPE